MTNTRLNDKSAIYLRPGIGGRPKGNVRIFPEIGRGFTKDQFGFVALTHLHQMDWSGASVGSDSRIEAIEITDLVFSSLSDSGLNQSETYAESDIENALLSTYRKASARAEELQIFASLLTATWLETGLYIASIGACRAYLLRAGKIEQLNVDDSAYITEDGVTYPLPNILSNSLGSGKIQTTNDIHLSVCKIEPLDLLILCNKPFYENVLAEEILLAETAFVELDKSCEALGTKATHGADAFDTVLLCMVRFE